MARDGTIELPQTRKFPWTSLVGPTGIEAALILRPFDTLRAGQAQDDTDGTSARRRSWRIRRFSITVIRTATALALVSATATLAEVTATLAEATGTRPIGPYMGPAHIGYVVPIGAPIAAHIGDRASFAKGNAL